MQVKSVIVIRGVIVRQSCEDGQTSFIINECPRLVLSDINDVIGNPQPLTKAV